MTDKPKPVTLHPQHKLLADKFLETGHKTKSAVHAGYARGSAHVSANKVLKRPDVVQYLEQQGSKLLGQQEDLQTKVLRELSNMAFANIKDFISIDSDGLPQVDFSNATEEQLSAIASVASKARVTTDKDGRVTKDTDNRFAMADKYRGLELLGKHLGMFKEAEQRVVVDVADRLLTARRRLESLSDGE